MRTAKPFLLIFVSLVVCSPNLNFTAPASRAAGNGEPTFAAVRISLQPRVTGLAQPVFVTHAHDDSRRLFIAERSGVIKVVQFGETLPTIFLDFSNKVLSDRLGGFVGLTFHPQHRNNGRFFVHYVRRGDAAVVTAEYKVSDNDPNRADPNSEKILLVQAKALDGHCGGGIEFGPDGFLYVGIGDGSTGNDPENNAQNLDRLTGKILRLDVDRSTAGLNYAAPVSNPFYGSTPGRGEIFAYGFRNPFRFSFDRDTGALYVGDVGEKEREEINLVTAGANYGWRVLEGSRCTNLDTALCNSLRSVAPLIEYEHTSSRCSVTGGYVYRGKRQTLPYGAYLYADLCSGELFLYQNGERRILLDTDYFIPSLGEDDEGELYVTNMGGTVYKVLLKDARDPEVQVLAPNDGKKLKGKATYQITWTMTGDGIYRQDIQFSTDGGESWQDVVGGLAGNVTSYAWTVPNVKTKAARVRVISYGNTTTGQDESDVNFKIVKR